METGEKILTENVVSSEDDIIHYGTPRHSGRYPWGSGDNPYQRNGDFLSRVTEYKAKGMTETEITRALNLKSTAQLRAKISIADTERRMYDIERAKSLREKGYGPTKIGEIMGGINESTVRGLLDPGAEERAKALRKTADFLKEQVKKKEFIDVGTGVELELGVSDTKMKTSIAMLEEEGYRTANIRVPQATNNNKKTTVRVMFYAPDIDPDTEEGRKALFSKLYNNIDNIKSITEYQSSDGGNTFKAFQYPESISSKRVAVRYDEDGGTLKDGVIELRRGVEDVCLGNSHYAQVRIAVDGTHYIKGMAMYSDDLPDGVDILVNSNKKKGTPLLSSNPDAKQVLKPMKVDKATGEIDKDNPFGALVKANGQSEYIGKDGKKHLRVINKLREEGDWEDYSKSLSPQMLGKQKYELIQRQLKLTLAGKQAEFDEIKSLTNPVIKKQLLESFADDCDAAAVHLKAAALPRQTTKVLLPVPSLKDNEIYAPTFKNGEHVVLIRYPHGGIFEIPELVVNNNHKQAKSALGNAADAVGINFNVASKLSGADFDGDTAVVIPVNSKVKITVDRSNKFSELQGFEPKLAYPYHEGMKIMTKSNTQKEMGKISNLITDMTLKGAPAEDIIKAVKHSMVVIDAEKHKLDYKQSEKDNDIETLKHKWQQNNTSAKGYGGASTLLSRSKSTEYVNERKMFYYSPQTIDPKTGEKIYTYTGATKRNGDKAQTESTKMAETKDAYILSSGTQKEAAYAEYANAVKALGNQARLEYLHTGNLKYDAQANKAYANEVESLNAKLKVAKSNAPKERMAQLIANSIVNAKKEDNPDMEKDELKKVKSQALAKARVQTGANKKRIDITQLEWEAIQAGAISSSKLADILKNTDTDKIRKLATPKDNGEISSAKQSRIRSLSSSGATIEQIATALGISTSTVVKYMKG